MRILIISSDLNEQMILSLSVSIFSIFTLKRQLNFGGDEWVFCLHLAVNEYEPLSLPLILSIQASVRLSRVRKMYFWESAEHTRGRRPCRLAASHCCWGIVWQPLTCCAPRSASVCRHGVAAHADNTWCCRYGHFNLKGLAEQENNIIVVWFQTGP